MTAAIHLSVGDKVSLFGNLSTMVSAGISLLEAIDSLAQDTTGQLKTVLSAVIADLHQGKRVSVSLAKFPHSFDSVTINLIRAAEEAGTLETTFRDLKEYIQKEAEFMDKVRLALVYPIFIIVVFTGVLAAILFFVVPRIALVFTRLNIRLPLPTRILVSTSDLLTHYPLQVLAVVLVLGLGAFLLFRFYRSAVLHLFYSLPLIRKIIAQIDITRFSRSLYLLLNSGVHITVALELTKNVVFHRRTASYISRCQQMVQSGKRLTDGLKATRGAFPSLMVKLVEAGEKSGTLDQAMLQVANHFDYQVTQTLKTVTAVLEPLLLVVVGLSVGGMMLAIIAPIYGLVGQIGAR